MNIVNLDEPLASIVQIRSNNLRAVNLERDLINNACLEGYTFTSQARRWLERIVEQMHSPSPVRAWTLTGPYGSGKSLFALFLMNLLARTSSAHKYANQQFARVDKALMHKIAEVGRLTGRNGWLAVPVTGYRAPLQQCIQHGLHQSLTAIGHTPAVQRFLHDQEMWSPDINSRKLTSKIDALRQTLVSAEMNFSGLLLIIDELGKSLEFTATHQSQADIYLLQELADLANRSNAAPFVLISILHQSFERYAGQLDTTTQKEWAKVQGRFEDIAFQEPPSQQMWLLANALEMTTRESVVAQFPQIKQNAALATQGGWCPPLMKPSDFEVLCQQAYPFHPTALVALPYLFRRLAQNERSIFAFLSSYEPQGFQEFLATHHAPAMMRLPDLFDYLLANYHSRLYGSIHARALTEAAERLNSASDLPGEAIAVLKTIALLNWLADNGPLSATETNILFALTDDVFTETALREALLWLRSQSIIVFRRFNGTYAIWQGSDVDIDAQLEIAHQRLGGTCSLAEALQNFLLPQPIVARRHSDQTGTIRYFDMRYVDAVLRDQGNFSPEHSANGVVLLCLSTTDAETDAFVKWASVPHLVERNDVVIGVLANIGRLHELLYELRCMNWVWENAPELRDDPVARREVRTRLGVLQTAIRNELDVSIRTRRYDNSHGSCWFYLGEEITQLAQRGLSNLLTFICDQLYHASPIIRNEIVNRRQLSTQGAAARRNLIEAMLLRKEQPLLGISGYPPERSVYASLLLASGLHQEIAPGKWGFVAPQTDPLRVRPIWQAMSDFIFNLPPQPRSVQDLFSFLCQPPFGVTTGVLPILLCVFLIVHANETTLYQEGSLLPEPGIADWEVLLRRPELFAVAGCRIEGVRASIIERLAGGLHTEAAAMPVIRELIRRLRTLPEYAWRTQQLSPATLAVRRAIEQARSPESLLFSDLPSALGITVDEENIDWAEDFFVGLNNALQDLSTCTPRRIAQARAELLTACGLSNDDSGWEQFLKLSREMLETNVNSDLTPLLRRAVNAPSADAAIESTLAYVANRPVRSWTDSDAERFRIQAQRLGRLFASERSVFDPQAGLTGEQRTRSQQMVDMLKKYVAADFDSEPEVIRAALLTLLKETTTSRAQ